MDSLARFFELGAATPSVTRPMIHLIGDCMVDEYYYIEANRISPEFPIAVMRSSHDNPTIVIPGGAGNAVMQFKHFNVDLQYFGLIDNYVHSLLENFGISTSHCVFLSEGSHVPVKRRLYNGEFPLCRWDIEEKNYGLTEEQLSKVQLILLREYEQCRAPTVAVFSDYDKGLFTIPRQWFGREDVITIIDPKKGPLEKWVGCTVFKPNAKEALELSGGITKWKQQCEFFQRVLGCLAVVITNGDQGVMGRVSDRFFEYVPRSRAAAESVIGAGDCFVSFMAMGLAYGMDVVDVVVLAYEAAKIYVQRKHNQPLVPVDLLRLVDPVAAKFVTPESLRNRDYRLVMTNGCFDLGLTANHIRSLQWAKNQGEKLVVAINDDESVRRLKGEGRPIMSVEERKRVVAGLECVDFVVDFSEDTPLELVKTILPDCLVKGGDYKPEDVAGYGVVPIIIHPLFEGLSTTEKINRLQKS